MLMQTFTGGFDKSLRSPRSGYKFFWGVRIYLIVALMYLLYDLFVYFLFTIEMTLESSMSYAYIAVTFHTMIEFSQEYIAQMKPLSETTMRQERMLRQMQQELQKKEIENENRVETLNEKLHDALR